MNIEQRKKKRDPRHYSSAREPTAVNLGSESDDPEKREYDGDPEREDVAVQTEHSEAVRRFVEAQSLVCNHDDGHREHHSELDKDGEEKTETSRSCATQGRENHEQRKSDSGHGQELKEARPSIVRIGH